MISDPPMHYSSTLTRGHRNTLLPVRLEPEAYPSPLAIEIGGVRFDIQVNRPEARRVIERRYEGYRSSAPSCWTIRLQQGAEEGRYEEDWIFHEGPVTHFSVATHRGWIDFSREEALVMAAPGTGIVYALERVMSYVCVRAFPARHEALLLHGAGVVIDGEGYVFFGASGRGKSTVASLARDVGTVLGEEDLLVRWNGRSFEVAGLPFWGAHAPVEEPRAGRTAAVPLRALYSLHHGDGFTLQPLSHAMAIVELLTSEKVVTERPEMVREWMKVAEWLVRSVPVARLHFRPTAQLWQFLGLNPVGGAG